MNDLPRLYDNLSRITYYLKILRHFGRPFSIPMHKPVFVPVEDLHSTAGQEPVEDLDDLAYRWAELPENPAVLDAGCGFGATLFRWNQKKAGQYTGYSTSPYQLKIAHQTARRLGVEENCRFQLRSYEEEITEKFDAIIAIEALIHATDLKKVLMNFNRALKPGGRLIIIDDMPVKKIGEENAMLRMLKKTWFLKEFWSIEEYLQHLAELELRLLTNENLTSFVKLTDSGKIDSRMKWLPKIRKFSMLPSAGMFIDTHLGGYALQRLYHEEKVGYFLLVSRKAD